VSDLSSCDLLSHCFLSSPPQFPPCCPDFLDPLLEAQDGSLCRTTPVMDLSCVSGAQSFGSSGVPSPGDRLPFPEGQDLPVKSLSFTASYSSRMIRRGRDSGGITCGGTISQNPSTSPVRLSVQRWVKESQWGEVLNDWPSYVFPAIPHILPFSGPSSIIVVAMGRGHAQRTRVTCLNMSCQTMHVEHGPHGGSPTPRLQADGTGLAA
ncbi:hypothetical protein NPIL_568411, partial [Nephila pilipes]